MSERALHLLALDRLAVLGNRSYLNPFLAKSYEMFLGPFGISPNYVELSLVACAAGEAPPLYVHAPRFRSALARAMGGPAAELLQPLLNLESAADVAVTASLRLTIAVRAKMRDTDTGRSLNAALDGGLEDRINAGLSKAEEYFRGFVAGAVGVLGDPDGDPTLQSLFLTDPAAFAVALAESLSAPQAAADGA